jgi:hypothetical protein
MGGSEPVKAPAPRPVTLEHDDAEFIRDVLALTDRYLRNPYRILALADGIALAAADGARCLTRHLNLEEDS